MLPRLACVVIRSHSVCIYCRCHVENALNYFMIDRSVCLYVGMTVCSVHFGKAIGQNAYDVQQMERGVCVLFLMEPLYSPYCLTIKSNPSLFHLSFTQ